MFGLMLLLDISALLQTILNNGKSGGRIPSRWGCFSSWEKIMFLSIQWYFQVRYWELMKTTQCFIMCPWQNIWIMKVENSQKVGGWVYLEMMFKLLTYQLRYGGIICWQTDQNHRILFLNGMIFRQRIIMNLWIT